MKPPPSREDIEEWARDLRESFLLCRELGHNWRPHAATLLDRAYERTLRCVRCKTLRVEVLGLRGDVLSKKYEYPEGYLSGGLGRIVQDGRDALRLESMQRTFKRLSIVKDESA